MENNEQLTAISEKIMSLQKTTGELLQSGAGIPAVQRNAVRIMASLKMLELDITEALELDRPA